MHMDSSKLSLEVAPLLRMSQYMFDMSYMFDFVLYCVFSSETIKKQSYILDLF